MKHPLHAFRVENRITLDAFAKILDVSVATVSRIENGKQAVTAEMAVAIEKATDGAVPRGIMRSDLWPPARSPANAEAAK